LKAVSRRQFHQHFTRPLFVQKSFLCLEFGFEQIFVQKMCALNVDEIDSRKHGEKYVNVRDYESWPWPLKPKQFLLAHAANIEKVL